MNWEQNVNFKFSLYTCWICILCLQWSTIYN